MTTITFHDLRSLALAVDGEPYPDYSGRGMYGAECAGVVLDDDRMVDLGIEVAERFEDNHEMLAALRRTSTDSMGRQTIVYWKSVQCTDAPEGWDA